VSLPIREASLFDKRLFRGMSRRRRRRIKRGATYIEVWAVFLPEFEKFLRAVSGDGS
jgi:hypothetical protein